MRRISAFSCALNVGCSASDSVSFSASFFAVAFDLEEEDNDNYGTFCVRSTGSSEQYGTFNVTNTNGPTRRDDPKVSQSAPDFSQMFREPESWEKHILALEKGEWTQGMEQNGAFKRWKKERPAMPSIYIREAARQDSK